ncbi:MAG: T9SS type A sorting domain-containing protein, partial [Bacteroidia bacterium]|nr:T9SS type A sorting domain-containing protein [Bacteroidia bacterium]
YSISDFTSSGSNLFVTSDYGVFVTSDFGQNWVAINDGLKNINTSSISVLNDTLYVGTYGNGVWMRSIADIHVYVQEFQQSDRSIKVYPNPASDLIYVSSSSKDAKFIIIDLVGKEVLSGNLNSSNEINVSGLASGSYLVVFQLENSVQATKLLINR